MSMNEKVSIELKYPITIDGTETSVLHMRRPKVRDQLLVEKSGLAGKGNAAQEVLLIANLCEVAPGDLENLDMADYKKLQETFGSFLEG